MLESRRRGVGVHAGVDEVDMGSVNGGSSKHWRLSAAPNLYLLIGEAERSVLLKLCRYRLVVELGG